MDSRDLVEDQEFDQEDKSMENASAELSALTLKELPHTGPRPKRFGEPMVEIIDLKRLKITEGEPMPERLHGIPLIDLADAPEAGPQLDVYDDGDYQDSDVVSDDDTTQKGDDISEWLVNFLNAVLDDDEDDEDPSMNFKEKRRQFRKRVNKCLAEALPPRDDNDVVSNHQDVSDEEDDIILSDLDEDDDILSVEDGEEVSDADDVVNSDEDGSDVDGDIFYDEEDDYLADEDDDDNNNDY
ncbi:hypothetical protein CAEBREN_07805 [Caenorhabditis brenneri]|uniref:Uncharacterized protein n=1 Tax=Caenorhabditis brenneri TaxID=135651 RepID=G0P3U9_CAEBE|nr:hypothetical protein CAEBREN_07805 [Caenorhabditis brenneri]